MELLISVGALFLVLIASASILYGTAVALLNLIKMSQHRRDTRRSWHDLWGMNRNNLIFFPSLLDKEGRYHRYLVLRGLKIILIGILCCAVLFATGLSEQI